MIRRTTLALAAALAGALLMSGVAQAASPLTLKCVRSKSATLRTCIADCRNTFKVARAACYGPGLQCALDCTTANDNCQAPVTKEFTDCNDICNDKQRDAIDECRSLSEKVPPATDDEIEKCSNLARLANLECKLDCTAATDDKRLDCNQQQAACLGACASCGLPNQCP